MTRRVNELAKYTFMYRNIYPMQLFIIYFFNVMDIQGIENILNILEERKPF